MPLPFKNGFELAQAMGYGRLYQASKQAQMQTEELEESTDKVTLTEQDIRDNFDNMLK